MLPWGGSRLDKDYTQTFQVDPRKFLAEKPEPRANRKARARWQSWEVGGGHLPKPRPARNGF